MTTYLHKHLTGPPAVSTRVTHHPLGTLATVEVDETTTVTAMRPEHLEVIAEAFAKAARDLRAHQATADPGPSVSSVALT